MGVRGWKCSKVPDRQNIQYQTIFEFKSPCNNGLKAAFYKYFSNELAPVLLGVYDSWGKLGTISVILEQESFPPYIKKVIKEILKTIDTFHF